jgi:FlaA1/EpsC-like NDP-sugar epimerase
LNTSKPITSTTFSNRFVSRLKVFLNVRNISYLPRWMVVLIDMLLVFVSAFVTYSLFSGMGLICVKQDYFSLIVLVFFSVNLFFFWLFRTYSGIIRHSSYIDAVKIFVALFSAAVFFLILNYSFLGLYKHKLFLNTFLFINFIFSFCFLFLYRITVKQTFEIYASELENKTLKKALIYGSDENAIAVANVLRSEKPKRFKIVGFIDKEVQNSNKRILDLPILHLTDKVSDIMKSRNASALIIANKNLSKDEKIVIIDDCLEWNYKVYAVPLISDLEDGIDISKRIKSFQIQDLLERKPIVLDNQSIYNQLEGNRILISGAAGSIGSEIVRQVLAFNPKEVIVVDQAESPLHSLSLEVSKMAANTKVITIIADLRNKESIEQIFKTYQPNVVFHAAAYKHVPLMEENPAQAVFVNVMGTKNIADLSCAYNVHSFVMVSTDKAVNPSNVMGASKRIAEKYVQLLHYKQQANSDSIKTKFITTRFGNVLGSNGSVVPLFTKQIAEGGPITITHPDIIRYFMTIPEACQLVLEAGAMGKGGEIFIFDMGKPVKIIDLAHKMIRLAGFIPEEDIKIKIVGLRPGEKLYEELLNDTSTTLPTHHEKIMIAQDVYSDCSNFTLAIDELILSAHRYSSNDIVAIMKKIVPEFKSMNSNFEGLDVIRQE